MALSQADLDRLQAAAARAQLTVEVDGKRITYRSMSEIMQAIAYVTAELQRQAGTAERNRMSYAAFDRGLDR